MKFTHVLLAMVMVSAILCADRFGVFVTGLVAASFLIITLIRSVISRKPYMPALVLTVGFMISTVSFFLASGNFAHPSLDYMDRYVTVNGTVISAPQYSTVSDNIKYLVRVKEITLAENTERVRDNILFTTPETFSCGDEITIRGFINKLPEKQNENAFDTAMYYKSQNVFAKIFSEDTEKTGTGFVLSPYFMSQKLYEKIDKIIYSRYYGDSAAIISAVLTGNTHHFSREFNNVLARTGFKRMFHPAYIHIWIITTLFGMLQHVTKKKYRDIAIIVFFALYAVFSSSNIGFIRCIITSALMIFYKRKTGSAHYPDIMADVFIFCAAAMPMLIFNVKLIVSAVGGMLIWAFMPHLIKRLARIPAFLRRTTGAMIICALFMTPLMSVYFNGICIYSFIAPFIMIPLVLLLLILTPIVFIMYGVMGNAPIIGSYYDLILWIIKRLPAIADCLPFSRIMIPAPSPASLLLIIMLIFTVYYYAVNNDKMLRFGMAASTGLLLSLTVSAIMRIGTTDFTFVNVGQGDGSVIHTAYGPTVIIDGGGGNTYSDYNPGEMLFVPYLESKGYYNIDAAFVSHFHQDHVQGVIAAIENLRVKNVFYMPPDKDAADALKWYEKLKAAADENGTVMRPIDGNTRITYDCGLTFSVYTPGSLLINSDDENDASLLIMAEYGGMTAAYTGDMTSDTERELLARGIDLDADVLKVAHHGSSTSTLPQWLNALTPDFAVISCGENNRYGHPTEQTLNTLKSVRVLRTDTDGDIRITADRNGIRHASKFK